MLVEAEFNISKGAYFRQVGQSRNKLMGLFYSIILLRELGIILSDDMDVISRLTEQISVISVGDVSLEKSDQIIDVMDRAIRQAVGI